MGQRIWKSLSALLLLLLLALFAGSWAMLWGLIPGTAAADEIELSAANREAIEGAIIRSRRDSRALRPALTRERLAGITALYLSPSADSSVLRHTPSLIALTVQGQPGTLPVIHTSDLTTLKHLQSLKGYGCNFDSLNWVSELPQLQELELQRNPVRDIQPLTQLTQLRSLDLAADIKLNIGTDGVVTVRRSSATRELDLSPLNRIPSLHELRLSGRILPDLGPILELRDLTELDASYTELQNIAGIENLQRIDTLYLQGNHIDDLSPILSLPRLYRVDIRGNPPTDTNIEVVRELARRRILLDFAYSRSNRIP